jgi:DNA-binding NarL/FixJ family response regulator
LHLDLLATIRAVHSDKRYLSPEIYSQLAEHMRDEQLSPGEVRILHLIAQGSSNKEIATRLSVSDETVKGHVRNTLSKLDVKDRTHAAVIGSKRGIIEL